MLHVYNVSYLFSLCCRTLSHPRNVVSTTAMEQSLLSLYGLDMVHECSHVHMFILSVYHVNSVQGIDYMHVSFTLCVYFAAELSVWMCGYIHVCVNY